MKFFLMSIVLNLVISHLAVAESEPVFFTAKNIELVQKKCTVPRSLNNAEVCSKAMREDVFQESVFDICLTLGAGLMNDWDGQALRCIEAIRNKVYSEQTIKHCTSKKDSFIFRASDKIVYCLEESGEHLKETAEQ